MIATAEIISRTQTALAYLEDGARETGLTRLGQLVDEVADGLVLEALEERRKYCARRVEHAVEEDTVARWAAAVERLDNVIALVRRNP